MSGRKKRRVLDEDVQDEEGDELIDRKMSVEERADLIDEVRKYPAIWNIKTKGYRDNLQAANGWVAISHSLEFDVERCKKEWQSLRKYYTEVCDAQGKHTRSGAGAGPAIKWTHWTDMQFLKDSAQPNKTRSNVPFPQPNNSFDENDVLADQSSLNTGHDSAAFEKETAPQPGPSTSSQSDVAVQKKRGMQEKLSSRDKAAQSITKLCEQYMHEAPVATEPADRFDAYGNHLATQLRELPRPIAIQLMAKISAIVSCEELKLIKDDDLIYCT